MRDITPAVEICTELAKTCIEAIAVISAQLDGFRKWLNEVAAEIGKKHELETALRWASVCNRSLYNRYRHVKKARIRKKYTKKILKWYRTEAAP